MAALGKILPVLLICITFSTVSEAQLLTGRSQPVAVKQVVEPAARGGRLLTARSVVQEVVEKRAVLVPQPIFDLPVLVQEDVLPPPPVVVGSVAPRGFLTRASSVEVLPVDGPGFAPVVRSAPAVVSGGSAPVDFQADQLDYDEARQLVIASGEVFLEQEGRILRADRVEYDLSADSVRASGNVVLNEVNGDIHAADDVELTGGMKDGVIGQLRTILTDGSRFTAKSGVRDADAGRTTMRTASYTACEPCRDAPDRQPAWQIKASKVVHDKEAKRVSYRNARFEAFGVPIAYWPYFSHSDGSVERESGFLAPSAGFKSDLGAFVETQYYWNIAPEQDATIGLTGYTKENPLLTAQWRKRWADASLQIDGGITNSERIDSSGGVERLLDDDVRGHLEVAGIWNINREWRGGLDVEYASDDQYVRQYDYLDEDVLTSDLYVERFSGRNYFATHLLSFQDVRVRENQQDQPDVLPEITARFEGDPAGVPVIGGNWYVDSSFLGLRREDDDGQDMDRFSLGAGWQRRFVSDTGLLFSADLSARQDFYNARDLDSAAPGSGLRTETTEERFFPQAHFVSSYPMVKQMARAQIRVEPIISATFAPNIDVEGNLPNEDSQDVQLDSLNLLNANRFPGLDRVEDQSRVTYGVRTGFYDGEHGELRTFLGQSYRLQDDDNPFPEGSGLSDRSSDVVGEISGLYADKHHLNYRFQLDSRNLSPRRHEVDVSSDFGRLNLGANYLFAKSLEGTGFDESREQLRFNSGYYWNPQWRSSLGFTQDLGEDPGLRQAYVGLEYFGQCVFFALTGQRNLTDDSSGESDTEILFRIGLKNIGEFQRSQWHTQ